MQDIRVKVGGIELQVREYEGEGEAILFMHFGGANLMVWQGVVSYFQDQYRLILVDLRGHGRSDRPQTGYHIDEMARDVAGVLDELGLERVHIVGSSLGAEVGLAVAACYPEKAISLACDGALYSEYGPYGSWEGSEEAFQEHATRQLDRMRSADDRVFDSIDELVADRRPMFEKYGWWNERVEAVERYGVCPTGKGKYARSWHKQARIDYTTHYFEYRFEDYYRRVKCPTIMLSDEEDLENETTRAAMQGLCELAARCELVAVPGWVHPYGWLLDPQEMCATVLAFLDRVRDGR